MVRCRGSQECGSRNVNFACKFHRRSHRVRITLKSSTLLFMRTRNVWTMKPWQRGASDLWTLTAYRKYMSWQSTLPCKQIAWLNLLYLDEACPGHGFFGTRSRFRLELLCLNFPLVQAPWVIQDDLRSPRAYNSCHAPHISQYFSTFIMGFTVDFNDHISQYFSNIYHGFTVILIIISLSL